MSYVHKRANITNDPRPLPTGSPWSNMDSVLYTAAEVFLQYDLVKFPGLVANKDIGSVKLGIVSMSLGSLCSHLVGQPHKDVATTHLAPCLMIANRP